MASSGPGTGNLHLQAWVDETARLTRPDRIRWCDGSQEEQRELLDEAVASGALVPLNAEKLPRCHLHRSDPQDVARVEHLTFICTPEKDDAGPTNNWMDPDEVRRVLGSLYDGCMRGRTMYVVPYLMGPSGSPQSRVGVELTDSVYVALNMRSMTRMGEPALRSLGGSDRFNRGLHSTGTLDPQRRYICHFPQDDTIWSYGSGYGGNALLGKKCFALRIASWAGRQEGWLAEHMLLVEVESPSGARHFVAAAFPSQCGKTNFAMMRPPERFAGWKVRTIGDDIAWLRVDGEGRLRAVNPEAGYFGVVPGTNERTNPVAMRIVAHDTIFTNVALAPDGTVWWEGKDGPAPDGLVDWRGRPWTPASADKAAHPNSRFTSPMWNNPELSPYADDPQGVPLSAIVFGGRRSDTVPLALEAFDWTHGVYLGATLASETTAAATGKTGVVRRDPMAMLPFCGYDMGRYFSHWLAVGRRLRKPPRIFLANWFRRGADGSFLWPGFGENMRVLEWMLGRVEGTADALATPAGFVPRPDDLDLAGLRIAPDAVQQALRLDADEWRAELESQGDLFRMLSRTMPPALVELRSELARRFAAPPREEMAAPTPP